MSDAPATHSWLREAAFFAAGHLVAVLWVFQGPLLAERVPFFRDICVYYYPNYVFASRALVQGVWPLWNPTSDAGAPFLLAEPLELALVYALGPLGALRVFPPLHLLLAMTGASLLARALGRGRLGALTGGTVYGLSGFVLSAANLFELFHAACWAVAWPRVGPSVPAGPRMPFMMS